MASSSSTSSQIQQTKYDVFISFRGSDIRHGFLSHLTKELCRKQINVYVDDRLERGDEISSSLVKAIEGSKISLIIFSKDYASSKWCLEELVKIIECKELNHQIVIPIFYNIDPTIVRNQKGTYGDAFDQHEQRSIYNMDKLQRWRSVLHKAANLSGYHYPSNSEDESKLIEKIVKDVRKKLDDLCPIDEPKGLVGIEENFAFIESLLKIESKEVRVIGIWGMGGIGKTTLADCACRKLSSQFESRCFLENVREESKKNGLSYLRKKLVLELLEEESLHIHDITRAKLQHLETRLRSKKVLLVLDDMDAREQLECLVRARDCWGPGSIVIITSRDKHVLNDERVDAIHEVQELNFQDSLKLFSLNAFNHILPSMEYEQLSKQVVGYAKGIPLALKVLGSHLHSRDMKTWESVIGKLKKHPNVKIQNVLKVSYDGLDYTEKEIFLDIAFFFKGENKDEVIRVLDACNFYAESGIAILLDKALVTISNDNEIQMHDLLQEMGEQIVREESIRNPGRRSRLKDVKEVLDVLKNNKGTDTIEGITLDYTQIDKDIHLSADVFNKMSNLRFLKISSPRWWERSSYVKLPLGLKSFPNELRYLHWDGYPLKSLPLASCVEKLVELCITNSDVQKLWDGVQYLVNLKKIDFSGSKQLTELPDFSKARNLEVVKLSDCESLCSVHPSILSCHTLISLYLSRCNELRSVQSEIHFESLKVLEVHRCYNLKEFSLSSEKMQILHLGDTKIEMLHSSFGLFKVLSVLFLNGSTLKSLPIKELCLLTPLCALSLRDFKQVISKRELSILFDALPNLEKLYLKGCINLFEIPDNISALSSLERLVLNKSGVETLPATIKILSKLKVVKLKHCMKLRSLPELPPSIKRLDFSGCTSLVTLPASIKLLLQLEEVWLEYCRRLESFPELPPSIRILDVTGCTSLERVHNLPVNHDQRPDYWDFSFLGCMKMDEQSLCNVMEFSHISMMMRPPYNNYRNMHAEAHVCYPGSTVPKWFEYKEKEKASITFELPPSSHSLLGFVFCCVLPQLPFTSAKVAEITCKIWPLERLQRTWRSINLKELNTDHVFVWYYGLIEDDEITTSMLEFRFFLSPLKDYEEKEFNNADLIKACGVCPIYASEIDNIFMNTKRHQDNDIDNDDQQLLPPTKKLKESCCTSKEQTESKARTSNKSSFYDYCSGAPQIWERIKKRW